VNFVPLCRVQWLWALGLLTALWAQKCRVATLSDVQFNYIRYEVASQSMEASRLELIRQVVSQNCLSLAQLKDLLWLLEHESTRLEVVRMATEKVYNPHNIQSELSEFFTTESGKRSFEKWLREWQKRQERENDR